MWARVKGASATGRSKPKRSGGLAGMRELKLLSAGFDAGLAASVATERAIDLHAVIDLVERGCPPELAARILAPLDHERRPC